MASTFPSAFGIGEDVLYRTHEEDVWRNGTVVSVRFTRSKVFYDVLDHYYAVVARDIDSLDVVSPNVTLGAEDEPV
jgi:hypothetical protein